MSEPNVDPVTDTVVCVRCRRTVSIGLTRDDADHAGRRRCRGSMATTCAGFERAREERVERGRLAESLKS
jgi:hypothetical protein